MLSGRQRLVRFWALEFLEMNWTCPSVAVIPRRCIRMNLAIQHLPTFANIRPVEQSNMEQTKNGKRMEQRSFEQNCQDLLLCRVAPAAKNVTSVTYALQAEHRWCFSMFFSCLSWSGGQKRLCFTLFHSERSSYL